MEPDDLLCSRNARPRKALVGRAQWEINQPPSLGRQRASLEGLLYGSRSTRAGEISILTPRSECVMKKRLPSLRNGYQSTRMPRFVAA